MKANFNTQPAIKVQGNTHDCFENWDPIFKAINHALAQKDKTSKTLVVECYQGVMEEELLQAFLKGIQPDHVITHKDYFLPSQIIEEKTFPDVTDDRIFGFMTRLCMQDFIDPNKLQLQKSRIQTRDKGLTLIFGYGASLIESQPDVLIYADMPRWEIQLRMRAQKVDNLGLHNRHEPIESKYKRGFFVDWRVCDRLKKQLMHGWDFILDSTQMNKPVMLTGEAFKNALHVALCRPFSLKPYFDQGPWGGQWMKEVCGLDPQAKNYAWCFNCVPEENSLLFEFNQTVFETPSVNLVFSHPRQLLGEAVHARFGDEFPIRFDFLDTWQGGNLSLQVHPITEYIQEKFGIHYTQDESYYFLDATQDAVSYLGLREGIDPELMKRELRESEINGSNFDADKYVEKWPVKKHDHVLIPGGTIHCSGKNSMVLEISSTPYIFTFKLWDWGQVGVDGKPRPINIEHGINVIQWDRTTSWIKDNLINKITKIAEGEGWVEEQTGLHEREFIETRRHWFTDKVEHHTQGGVNVLCLVEGSEALVECPDNTFDPFVVHYAETFIVPANVQKFTIKPHGQARGTQCATIKAYVRT